MCGVAGIFHYADPAHPVDEALLVRMTRLLAHRGPDDEGFYIEGPLGLGHRRLAILDTSRAGHQPMTWGDRQHWLSYNGEIYNHLNQRAALQNSGTNFVGTSDTETLLHALVQNGPQALAQMAGIFALAYWDAPARRLVLARDPLGVKQLYYYDDGRRILFASEIKALLACPQVPRDIDHEAMNEYLHFHTPLFERTFFRAIKQVKPAEYIDVSLGGRRAHTYWHVHNRQMLYRNPDERVDALRALLDQVVREQLRADVPVGVYCSGGIDSSAVAAVARQQGQALRCFGVTFQHPGIIDERPYQESITQALGLPLETLTVQAKSLPEDLLRLMYFQDQPLVGAAMLPMYHVSRMAAKQVKVCLGGQAADEVFGGYARYALADPLRVLTSMGTSWRRNSDPSGADTAVRGSLLKQLTSLRNLGRLSLSMGRPSAAGRYFANFAHVPESLWRSLAPDAGWLSRERAGQVFREFLQHSPAQQNGNKLLHWDVRTYLTGLFQQEDRMSMANSLESRLPLADPRLVQFAFATDFDLKLRHGATKWILREAVAPQLPEVVLNRRKVGFDTPAPAWLRGPCRGFLEDLLTSRAARSRGLWDGRQVERFVQQTRHPKWFDVVWKLACMEAWSLVFVDRAVKFDETPTELPTSARAARPANA